MLRVGGPSTAAASWIPEFLAHTKQSGAAVDFVSTHAYGAADGFITTDGKRNVKLTPSPDAIIGEVRKTRTQMKEAGYPDMPLYFTEWNASWSLGDPVLDTYIMAPYILSNLKGSQGMLQGMSFWTYSDLFEELGPPKRPFGGGFGMMTIDGIRKPAWFAYKYLNQLGDTALNTVDQQSYAAKDGRNVQVLLWDLVQPENESGNRAVYGKVLPTHESAPVKIELKGLKRGSYAISLHRTGFEANDPYTAYLKMGSPKSLTAEQVQELQSVTQDRPETSNIKVNSSGTATFNVKMRVNDVVLVKVSPQ